MATGGANYNRRNLASEFGEDISDDILLHEVRYEKAWYRQQSFMSKVGLEEHFKKLKVRSDFHSRHDWPSEEKIFSFFCNDRFKNIFESKGIPNPAKLYNHQLALDLWAFGKIEDYALHKVGYRTVGWRIKVLH